MSYKPSGDLVTVDGRTSQYVASGYGDNFTIHMDSGSLSADTGLMVIDLSDTTNWPHTNTGHAHVTYMHIMVNPDASFLGAVRFGVLSSVDATNGVFNDRFNLDFSKKSELFASTQHLGSNGMHMEPTAHFGPAETSTLFQTDVNLQGPDGTTAFPSGDGDVVLLVEVTAGTVAVSITVGYETIA